MKNSKCKVRNARLMLAGLLLAGLLGVAGGCVEGSDETDGSANSNAGIPTAVTNSGTSGNAADSTNGPQGTPFGVRQSAVDNSTTNKQSPSPATNEIPGPMPEEKPQSVVSTPLEQPAARVRATEGDWPRFRGRGGSGVSSETGLPLTWSATENIVWKVDLPGPGASSPITLGDHIYVTCYSGYGVDPQSPGNLDDLKRHLVCVDRKSGKILWDETIVSQTPDQPLNDSLGKHGYASSTPVADVDGVYVFYGASGVAAYTHAGGQRWHRSCGTHVHDYGSASSPILVDDMLIVDASVESDGYPGSAGLYALDKRTGEEIWKKTNIGGGGYLTPTLVETNGRRELVVSQPWGHEMAGASVENGERLWFCKVSAYTPTPVVDSEGILYVLSKNSYAAIRSGGSGDVTNSHVLWEQKSAVYRQSSPLYWEGHVYWMPMDGGIACCADAKTGELVYRERISPETGQVYASPVLADGRIYYVSREKGTFVLPARPEFELLAHNVIATDSSIFNGSPAVSGGRILLRSNRCLYCIGAGD